MPSTTSILDHTLMRIDSIDYDEDDGYLNMMPANAVPKQQRSVSNRLQGIRHALTVNSLSTKLVDARSALLAKKQTLPHFRPSLPSMRPIKDMLPRGRPTARSSIDQPPSSGFGSSTKRASNLRVAAPGSRMSQLIPNKLRRPRHTKTQTNNYSNQSDELNDTLAAMPSWADILEEREYSFEYGRTFDLLGRDNQFGL